MDDDGILVIKGQEVSELLKGQELEILRKVRLAYEAHVNGLTVFSPFGLGILDLAVSSLVCELAEQQKVGTVIESFLPESWI
jgi:ornithine cyclodeaminase/alanine dehydrogenase-like protein (mu-crystallin family)